MNLLTPPTACRGSIALILLAGASLACAEATIGADGTAGTLAAPKTVSRLEITKPGVYENLIVDGAGVRGNLVKITGLAFGKGVGERIRFVNGKAASGFESTGEHDAPPLESLLRPRSAGAAK